MAIVREAPKCIVCGKENAKAVYKDQSNLPDSMVVYGDTFLYWKPMTCGCDGKNDKSNKSSLNISDVLYCSCDKQEIKETVSGMPNSCKNCNNLIKE